MSDQNGANEIVEKKAVAGGSDADSSVVREAQDGFKDWRAVESRMKSATADLHVVELSGDSTQAGRFQTAHLERSDSRPTQRARSGKEEGTEVTPQAMTARSRERIREISQKYGVKFTTGGRHTYDGYKITAGVPTGDELDALEKVLKNVPHVNLKGLEIMFVDKNRRPRNEFAVHESDGSKKRILIMPLGRIRGTEGWDKVEADLSHEVAHEEQHQINRGLVLGHPVSSEEGQRVFRDMGWTYNQRTGPRLLDRNGGEWAFSGNRHWDFVGGTRPGDNKTRVTNDEMRELAKIRPASTYFDNPDEMHAEAISRFRTDRRGLAGEAADMYFVAKAYDQRMIDRAFKNLPPGSLIRSASGDVVAATPENIRKVEEAERRWGLVRQA